jgi:hypothetical protein
VSSERVDVATTATAGRPEAQGWWFRYWNAVLGRETYAETAEELDTSVSFAELVWAHYERQKEVYEGVIDGDWEMVYRRRLKRFKQEHGEIRKDYWCRFQASGVALTTKRLPRRPGKLWRRDEILRLHSVTDWRTAAVPEITISLHGWQTLAIKAGEILRNATEHMTCWSRSSKGSLDCWPPWTTPRPRPPANGKADRTSAAVTEKMKVVLTQDADQFRQAQNYYTRAGENSARIVYFRGMLNGAALCGIVIASAALVLWAVGDWRPSSRDLLPVWRWVPQVRSSA